MSQALLRRRVPRPVPGLLRRWRLPPGTSRTARSRPLAPRPLPILLPPPAAPPAALAV